MNLDIIREDEDYYYIKHPVAGEVGIRKDIAADKGGDAQYMNKGMVGAYAKFLEETGQTPDNMDAFGKQLGKEMSASARGIYELSTDERTTSYEEDFMHDVFLETNPISGYTGAFVGAIADPVTFAPVAGWVAKVGKALQMGRLAIMAGAAGIQGAISGAVQPVREEFGDSRLSNAAFGAGAGAVLGGALHIVARRLGFSDVEDLQRTYDESSTEAKEELQKKVEETTAQVQKQSDASFSDEQIDAVRNEFEANLKEQQRLTQEMRDRQAEELTDYKYKKENGAYDGKTTRTASGQMITVDDIDGRRVETLGDEFEDVPVRQQRTSNGDVIEYIEIDGRRVDISRNGTPIETASRIAINDASDIGAQFNRNLERIQSERMTSEFNQNLDRIQREGANQDLNSTLQRAQVNAQFNANLRNIQAENAPKNVADQVRSDLIAELGERIQSVAGTAETGRVGQEAVTALRKAKKNVDAMLKRASEGKKTKLSKDELERKRASLVEDIENAVARRDATKAREQNVKDLVALKAGRTTPEYNQRLKTAMEQVNMEKVEVPEVRPPIPPTMQQRPMQPAPPAEVMDDIQRVTTQPMPQPQMNMPARPIPQAVSDAQGVFKPIEAPVQAPTTAPPTATLTPDQVPTNRPKSLSSGGTTAELPASSILRILNMQPNSKAAQSLPEPRAAQSTTLTPNERVRQSALQEEEARLGIQPTGVDTDGGRITDAVIDREEADARRAMQSAMNDGLVSSPAEWLMMRFDEQGGRLSIGEGRLLEIASNEALVRRQEVQTIIRANSRKATREGLDAIQKAQLIEEELELFRRLREFEQMAEYTKGYNSAALRDYRRTNAMARRHMKALQEGRMVEQLFFGVDC